MNQVLDVCAAVFVLSVLIALLKRHFGRRPKAAGPRPLTPAEEQARDAPLVPIEPAALVVKRHDERFFYEGRAEAMGIRDRREWTGGYAGVSLHIPRTPVSLRSGGSRGESVRVPHVTVLDRGTLLLSDQRILLLGGRGAIEIALTDVVSVNGNIDGFSVISRHLGRVGFETGDRRAVAILLRLLHLAGTTRDSVVDAAQSLLGDQ